MALSQISPSFKRLFLISFVAIFIVSCASVSSTSSKKRLSPEQAWIDHVVHYQQNLPEDLSFDADEAFELTPEISLEVLSRFATTPRNEIAKEIALWLLDKDGHNMQYDVNANFTPVEAFNKQRGNCLSFTLLLSALANELGAKVQINAVEIPQTWDLNESLGVIFFRHVNGVQIFRGRTQIYDLAIEEYSPGYPQKIIKSAEANALLQNNIAVSLLAKDQIQKAEHLFKIALSIDPKNPDIWVNLGVLKKRNGEFNKANYAFKKAYKLDSHNIPAVSNLERLHRQQGNTKLADKFVLAAKIAREANPYFHYRNALNDYSKGLFFSALKHTNAAINIHAHDPRFYELKNLIAQQQGKYVDAEQALLQARALASNYSQAKKYNLKLESIRRL